MNKELQSSGLEFITDEWDLVVYFSKEVGYIHFDNMYIDDEMED